MRRIFVISSEKNILYIEWQEYETKLHLEPAIGQPSLDESLLDVGHDVVLQHLLMLMMMTMILLMMLMLMTTMKVMMSNKHLVAAVDLETIEGMDDDDDDDVDVE